MEPYNTSAVKRRDQVDFLARYARVPQIRATQPGSFIIVLALIGFNVWAFG
jgi:hypothetical protein